MKTITLLGIDLAKEVFELRGVDALGNTVLKRTLKRDQLAAFTVNLPPCRIAMEACGGAHYWCRLFQSQGHRPQMIAAQHVKPFRKSRQKNDANDAEAIVEAALRPSMKYVGIKNLFQQDIQSLHRYRQQIVEQRTALVNQIRGLLTEYGIVVAQGIGYIRKELPIVLENKDKLLTFLAIEIFSQLHQDLIHLDEKVKDLDKRIAILCEESEACTRIKQIEGIGPLTATAVVAAIGNVAHFKNGRHLAAWLGLVPRQYSSGNKNILLGIS